MTRTLSPEVLIAWMKPGKPYAPSQVGMQFKVGTSAIRVLMQRLTRDGLLQPIKVDGIFMRMKPATAAAAELPAMRPLKISPEMRRAMERTQELYVHRSRF
jgi:DNA-binding GntR family transcriptional regulator